VESDYRDKVHKLSGQPPIYFLTGEYDFACTPEMTMRTAEKVKNSECIIFGGGHFPTSEDPDKFKEVITPVLKKILQNDPERRGGATENWSSNRSSSGGGRPSDDAPRRRVIDL